MANTFYLEGAQKILGGQIDFSTHVINAALVPIGSPFACTQTNRRVSGGGGVR